MSRRWTAEVHIAVRGSIADPEGQTIASALRSLGYESVSGVRSGKLLRIELAAPSREAADALVADMCGRLLANPVVEDASWEIAPNETAEIGVTAR